MKRKAESVAGKPAKKAARKTAKKAGAVKAPARKVVAKKKGKRTSNIERRTSNIEGGKGKARRGKGSKRGGAEGAGEIAEKKKPGRPTKFSQELADEICRRFAAGDSMRKICEDPRMPHRGTVKDWRETYPEFSSQYARALQDGSDLLVEDIVRISDDTSQDLIPSEFGPKPNNAAVARARLQVDTRKWILAKREPDRFGDKVTVGGDKEKPLQHEITLAPGVEAAIAAASAAAATVQAPAGEMSKRGGEQEER